MFLPTLEVSENELMNADTLLPYIRRGQWVRLKSTGLRGQFVGFNHSAKTVRIAWHREGRKFQQTNNYLKMCAQHFDRQMENLKEKKEQQKEIVDDIIRMLERD
jgi:hypothetical protein